MGVNVNEMFLDLKEMKDFFDKFGIDVIGSKEHNSERIYFVKKKKKE
jgi:hypothetical protein